MRSGERRDRFAHSAARHSLFMDKKKLLVQLDPDPQPSLFDRIVGFDAGADEVLAYGGVRPADVRDLIHGCIFTRGAKDLARTAVFIGGKNVEAGEALLAEARKHLLPQFGLTVSLMLDANGANTTAAAALRVATRQAPLAGATVAVLGAGAVGARIALLLALQGATVELVDPQASRAESIRQKIRDRVPAANVHTDIELAPDTLARLRLLIAAGPIGKQVLEKDAWAGAKGLAAIIDLNATPPLGVEGVEVGDDAKERQGIRCTGALAVGGLKMKIHKAAIARLFAQNDLVLDAEAILPIAMESP